jgi:hypothetical protein
MPGFRSPVPPLGISSSANEVGYRSLLGFWTGGATSFAPTTDVGYRSLLGFWVGGATSFTPNVAGGYRGLLGFWLGGAGNGPAIEPTPTPEQPATIPYANPVRPLRYRQHAFIVAYERPDEYGWLIARAHLRALLQPLNEAKIDEVLLASASIRADIIGEFAPEEISQLLFKRGLPNKALLALLMSELLDD